MSENHLELVKCFELSNRTKEKNLKTFLDICNNNPDGSGLIEKQQQTMFCTTQEGKEDHEEEEERHDDHDISSLNNAVVVLDAKKKTKKGKKKKKTSDTNAGRKSSCGKTNLNISGEREGAVVSPTAAGGVVRASGTCKKCSGIIPSKKGERTQSSAASTCPKCGARLQTEGDAIVKINEPGSANLAQGGVSHPTNKVAKAKALSPLEFKNEDHPRVDEQMSSRISLFAQRLQYCSRECADLYPLIITLRSLQLKKTSATPQQRKSLETQIRNRLLALEEEISEMETFESKFLKKSPSARGGTTPNYLSIGGITKKKKNYKGSLGRLSPAGSEMKESKSERNSSLFDSLSLTSPTVPLPSTSARKENHAISTQPTPGAAAFSPTSPTGPRVSALAPTASSKSKPSLWYIENVEKLNSRLVVMHENLTRYCMIQSVLIQNKTEHAIAKAKKNENEALHSLKHFARDVCKGTTQDCLNKVETKHKDIKNKQRILTEAKILTEHCIATGDQEGLHQMEVLLHQFNLDN